MNARPAAAVESAVKALARRARRSESDVLEEWAERAAIMEFDARQTRSEAEESALRDMRKRYEPQRSML